MRKLPTVAHLEGVRRDRESLERVTEESQVLVSAGGVSTSGLFWHLFQFFCREVRRIRDRSKVRYEWRVDVAYCRPIHTIEERMLFNLLYGEAKVLRGN